MKTENDFNAWLGKQLTLLHRNGLHHQKVSDKFAAGIPDFFIWLRSTMIGMENKFISEWPSDKAMLLKHIFDGVQHTYLESLARTGNPAWGAIGVKCDKTIYLVRYDQIPPEGNWNTGYFKSIGYPCFKWTELEEMLTYCLEHK